MSYRIVRITNLYNEYLQQFYRRNPGVEDQDYESHHSLLIDDSLDTASSFVRNLNKEGVEAYDFFSNALPLQGRWAQEHRSELSGVELCAEQIKVLKPDVAWLDDIRLIDAEWVARLREAVPSLKIVTGHLCAPYYKEDLINLKALDFVITCTPCLKREFEEHGIETHLLYHAFDSYVLEKISGANSYPITDLLFTGSLYTGGSFHMKRIEFMETLLKEGLPLKLYGNIDSNKKVLSKIATYYVVNALRKMGWQNLIKNIPVINKYESYGDNPVRTYSRTLKKNLLPPVYGVDQFRLLAKSRISFNLHIDMAKSCAGNARLFEATGVGSCLVTDWKENLPELFVPEKEVVTFRSKEECVDKIKWLLSKPGEVEKIGRAGQARTLRDHSTSIRVRQFNEIVYKRLKG